LVREIKEILDMSHRSVDLRDTGYEQNGCVDAARTERQAAALGCMLVARKEQETPFF